MMMMMMMMMMIKVLKREGYRRAEIIIFSHTYMKKETWGHRKS